MVWMKTTRIENILKQCDVVAELSRCRRRKFGAIITDSKGVILSQGYNGSARGSLNCGEDIPCIKDLYDAIHYGSYDLCSAVHAEENAIINAARKGTSIEGGVLFLGGDVGGRPCRRCARTIINAGIFRIVYKTDVGHTSMHISSLVKQDNEWMVQMERDAPK